MISIKQALSEHDVTVQRKENDVVMWCNHANAYTDSIDVVALTYSDGIYTPDDTEAIEVLHCEDCGQYTDEFGDWL